MAGAPLRARRRGADQPPPDHLGGRAAGRAIGSARHASPRSSVRIARLRNSRRASSGADRSGSPGSTRRTGSRPARRPRSSTSRRSPNRITIESEASTADRVVIRETWDPGWTVHVDGRTTRPAAHRDTFLAVDIAAGKHIIELEYQPIDVTYGLFGSAAGVVAVILALTGSARFLNSWNKRDRAWTDPSPPG